MQSISFTTISSLSTISNIIKWIISDHQGWRLSLARVAFWWGLKVCIPQYSSKLINSPSRSTCGMSSPNGSTTNTEAYCTAGRISARGNPKESWRKVEKKRLTGVEARMREELLLKREATSSGVCTCSLMMTVRNRKAAARVRFLYCLVWMSSMEQSMNSTSIRKFW